MSLFFVWLIRCGCYAQILRNLLNILVSSKHANEPTFSLDSSCQIDWLTSTIRKLQSKIVRSSITRRHHQATIDYWAHTMGCVSAWGELMWLEHVSYRNYRQCPGEQACSTCVSFRFFAVFVLLRETGGLWENWLIAKTAFPSPRCDVPHAPLVGAARSRISFGFWKLTISNFNLSRGKSVDLRMMVDADFAGDQRTRRSRSGYLTHMNTCLFSENLQRNDVLHSCATPKRGGFTCAHVQPDNESAPW